EKKREEFKKELYEYVDNWEKISTYVDIFENELINLYKIFKDNKITKTQLGHEVNSIIIRNEDKFNGLFSHFFCLDESNLLNNIIKNLISKIQRMKKIEEERDELPDVDIHKNIETAFRSGFYMHFRDVMNYEGNRYQMTLPKKIANYYFVREFCYGSMFRFNSSGHFNIPYGGIAYNSKDFRKKVDYIFSNEVIKMLGNTSISNKDFETFLRENHFSNKDFIFIDPPYDSDFSDYEKKKFGKNDQLRLADCLSTIKANFILIIKNTDFIFNLYKNMKNIKIDSFEKSYLYNVKGRNNRDVEHLIIYNF
ncbi:MAG: DNA adenine methylase, partial [Campylobacterales bacterium]